MFCSGKDQSIYLPGIDPRSTIAWEGSSPSPLEPDTDRGDIQAEIPGEAVVQAVRSVRCRVQRQKKSQWNGWQGPIVPGRLQSSRDAGYLAESNLPLWKLITTSSRWIYQARRIRSSRNRNARAWYVPSLCTSSASLARGFLPELALGYIASRQHRLMASITTSVYRREASALRNYMTRLEEDRTSQEMGWPMPLKRWAHRRN